METNKTTYNKLTRPATTASCHHCGNVLCMVIGMTAALLIWVKQSMCVYNKHRGKCEVHENISPIGC